MTNRRVITANTPKTVPLEEAAKQTTAYRQTMDPKGINVKAFYIELKDLLGALQVQGITVPEDYHISGIRVYMAINDLPEGINRNHIYVVATEDVDGRPDDIVQDVDGNSLIYDMTWPCPSLCSSANVLTGPEKKL